MTTTQSSSNKSEQLRLLKEKVKKCKQCEELANYRTQTVFDDGNPDAELVFIGQAPGEHEDEKGNPFVSSPRSAGKFLNDKILSELQLTRQDVFICNIICCWPSQGKSKRDQKPTCAEVKNCRHFLDETLAIIKPKFICCLGSIAAKSLLETTEETKSLRGKKGLKYKGIPVVCTYHPSSSKKKEILEDIQGLKKAMRPKEN